MPEHVKKTAHRIVWPVAGGTFTHWIGSRGKLLAMGNSLVTEPYVAQSKELEYIAFRREELKDKRGYFQVLKIILCTGI